MDEKTNKGLKEWCEKHLGVNYVYGMKMQIMTQAKYDYLYKRFGPSLVWPSDSKKVGTTCTDCSGLISSYTGKEKSSQMYYNEAKERNNLSTIEDAPVGALLWMQGHVGVYIGNNKCIEARGSAYGVVCTRVDSRPWQHWFLCNDIIYIEEPSDCYLVAGPMTGSEAKKWADALPQAAILRKE